MADNDVDPKVDPKVDERGEAHPVTLIAPREVPLGGPRAMTVRRTLPARRHTTIGAFCFLDHYGPDDVSVTGGMDVAPHPHTGLQTVSWLFSGTIEHRDSTGVVELVRPGHLNLMSAGRGVSHSEVSTPETTTLHGVQLWVVLPDETRWGEPGFIHHEPQPVVVDRGLVTVFLGSIGLRGGTVGSPVETHTPLLGAEIVLAPGAHLVLDVDPAFEHGVLADSGPVTVRAGAADPVDVPQDRLAHCPHGSDTLVVETGEQSARVILIGGPPFREEIVMWWNFIGRTHDEVVAAREQWQSEIAGADPERFGRFDFPGDALPAPPLPMVRLLPRGSRHTRGDA